MLTGKIGNEIINCYDGTRSKEQLKNWAKKKIILCPACNKPYEYCHGRVKIPYFRHMDKAKCEDKYSESKTEDIFVVNEIYMNGLLNKMVLKMQY